MTAEGDFVDDGLGLDNPADKDTGGNGGHRHQNVVAQIVQNIQDLGILAGGGVGQDSFEVQGVVTQADQKTDHTGHSGYQQGGLLAIQVELIHHAGDQRFHNGNGGGQCCEGHGHEEEDTYNGTDHIAHGGENLGQSYEHQRGTAVGKTVSAHKGEHGRDDHHTGQERNGGVEQFDLVDRLVQIRLLGNIRTVGDHNTHGHADGVEQLAHGIGQHHEELLQGHALKVGNNIYHQTLQTGAGHTAGVSMLQKQGEHRNTTDKHQQNGHQNGGELFYTLVDAVVDHQCSGGQEDDKPDDGFPLGGDEAGEVSIRSGCTALEGQECRQILQYPAADGAVVGQD